MAVASTTPPPGARLTVPGTESVTVTLASGQLEFAPGSIFTLNANPTALSLEFGEVRAIGLAEPLAADFGFGVAQLAPGGRLIIPVGPPGRQELTMVIQTGDHFDQLSLGAVSFVPLVAGK